MSQQLDIRKQQELSAALSQADYVLMKNYQYELTNYPVLPPSEELTALDVTKHCRLFKVQSIAYNKVEDNLIKLSNVYNALSAVDGSVLLIIDSDGEQVDFYIGTRTKKEEDIHIAFKTLEKTLSGNFPGCVIKNMTKSKLQRAISNLFYYRDDSSAEEYRTISAVSGISSMKNFVGNTEKTEFAQGIEKLVDSMRGETYSLVIIADPIPQRQIDTIKKGYEGLYTKLVPFASAELSLGYTEGSTLTDSITKGVSDTISESLTLSQSHSHASTTSTTTSTTKGIGFIASASKTKSKTETESDTYTEGSAETKGTSNTKSFSTGFSNAISTGKSHNLQIKTEEKSIQSLLGRIDTQLERLAECGDLGMWNCAAYFIADDLQISKTAASTYQALIRGENSGLEAITVNTWSHDDDNGFHRDNYSHFTGFLQKLTHPEIFIGENMPIVNPTALISGSELTLQAGLPQHSVLGLAVAEYASFGREVLLNGGEVGSTISLGNVYHMGVEERFSVQIDKESLAAHTFITGSTGSGKSNAVYQMLSELSRKKVPFLVIEPAKGEYKHIFGNRGDVHVFGTNPKKTPVLKVNPFKFPSDIHVLEHIDRLIEIFNVCWPMYAAMPAVLKDAVEKAYLVAGWDLEMSENKYTPPLYPSFSDVLEELYIVISDSDFSAELKSNYTGALITRVKSLTNGINGQIFSTQEIGDRVLFDSNTIVDLSRVSSTETKALIMGILVMKLQEYRIAEGGMNRKLRHVTVLEEAHNLLKRTSTEQASESSNLLGKSVEMLSQSIAEMRTYGEGFIIVDQSPNMLDMSVIRNTNTKIILRLPDMSDRELCGRAANLNDDQIIELAKLPTGVAAVYQNNWIEPVLSKVKKFDEEFKEYRDCQSKKPKGDVKLKQTLIRCLLCDCAKVKVAYGIDDIIERIMMSPMSTRRKIVVIESLKNPDKSMDAVKRGVCALFNTDKLPQVLEHTASIEQGNDALIRYLDIDGLSKAYQRLVLQCILKEASESNKELNARHGKWCEYMRGEIK